MKVLSVINNDKDAVTKEYVDSKAGVTAVDPTSGPVETNFFIPTKTSELTNDSGFITEAALTTKQDTLVSGTNIKTINNQSLLGSGNINIQGGGSGGTSTDVKINGTSITSGDTANIAVEGTYNASTNKLMTKSEVDGYDASWIYTRWPSVADFNAFYNYVKNGGIRVYFTSQYADFTSTALFEAVEIGEKDDEKYISIYRTGGLVQLDCDGTRVTRNIVQLFETTSNKVTSLSSSSSDDEYPSAKCVYDNLATKQPVLVSGTNIKTINNTSILGNGNISLPQVTDSYSASTTDSYSCNYVNGLNGKVLWRNPRPTSDFSSQTIALNSSDYDLLEIFYYDYAPSSGRGCLSARVIKGKNTTLQAMFRESGVEFIGERKINYISDIQLSVLNNYSIARANSFDKSVYNDWNVPIYVIGYKTGLFD